MRENPEEVTVIVNHARKETRELMIEKGICYMRAGESDGSLQVTPGFEKMRYVLLHTGGDDAQLFHIKKGKEGTFSIWKKETLEQHGFHPEHACDIKQGQQWADQEYYDAIAESGGRPIF